MKFRSLAFTLPALLFAADASATRQPDYLDERPVEPAAGARGRATRTTSWDAPRAQVKQWQAFVAAHGSWRALWDVDSGVPLRIWGEGIPAPGANADAARAEAAARAMLAEQLPLLAPGASVDDFRLVSNVVHGDGGHLRTVGFVQTYRGLRVLGGQVSFLFERDRLIILGSEAAPRVDAAIPSVPVTAADALGRAQAWIASAYGAQPTFLADGGVAVLPLYRASGDTSRLEFHAVRILTLDLADPRARWDVYVDAATGAPIARHQTLMFGAGTVRFNTPLRYPRAMREDDPAPLLSLMVNGGAATTGEDGSITWSGSAPATLQNNVTGTRVKVTNGNNGGGAAASNTMQLADGGSAVWNASDQPTIDSQVVAFVHANRIKAISKADLAPELRWLDDQLQVNVNENGSCNAYSTGDDIHFFSGSGQCENTGRIPDVIYHEFGHSLHAHSIIDGAGAFDTSMSEGVSDYLAATTVNDSGMGRGFFLANAEPLRDLDPVGSEARWPEDIDDQDPHMTGLIIGGALWDLRKEMIAAYGPVDGKHKADLAYYATLQRAADIPSTYPEVLAEDDDNGNLADGTPNKCAIDRAFGPHGLVDPTLGLGLAPPVRTGNDVTVTVAAPAGGCPPPQISGIVLQWRLRGDGALQSLPLTRTGNDYRASIPTQPDGSIVQYKVTVTIANGTNIDYPANVADPLYEYYVGPLVPVYCTDFESDPFANGWTHGRTSGNDDWEWGVPNGSSANGDPDTATSGTHVIGNDLGTGTRDGLYSPDGSDWAMSPVIDVSHATGVRLQYRRWLGVEDGFYDDAEIYADGDKVWANLDSGDQNGPDPHRDREWRFQDLDLSAQAADGSVQIKFALTSDQGLEYGGWNIDDFCIMARTNILPGCGNGTLDPGEQCDDGNNVAGDGCTESCTTEPGATPSGDDDGGCCSTGNSPAGPIGLGLASAALLVRRRRRRA
ncbi:MAG TPA: myxococcus cysteine-rich repeat containing protein [Kofleriaceae bacterium]|nr:myxococcus cysteine-rich repeat containing protein [Kofleriaceae bacterium]